MHETELVFAVGVLILRLALVAAGVAFANYGFRLFARVRAPGSAEVSIGKVLKINLAQVAPGVFFSLFGAAVLLYGIHRPPELRVTSGAGLQQLAVAGATTAAAPPEDAAAGLRAAQQIAWLNRIRIDTSATAPADVSDRARLLRDIRLSLMRGVWRPEWGDAADFEAWLRDPGRAASPNATALAVYERR